MKVTTPAGDLEVLLKSASVEGDFIVLKVQMGVWNPKIYISKDDLWFFFSILLRPSALLYFLKLPFRFLFRRNKNNKAVFYNEIEVKLNEEDLDPSPIKQFEKWYENSLEADFPEPNAMTLATATIEGKPAARMLLLKGFDDNGFVFYSNCRSSKGEDLSQNPQAAIVFWWPVLERQIRIEGTIHNISDQEADSYFKSRPRESCLGAWASQQSRVISNREVLEKRFRELEEIYKDREIPRPPYWLGYRLRPLSIEFWQGRPNRLHDRLRYRLVEGGRWIIERLAP